MKVDYGAMTEVELLAEVRQDWYVIKHIKKPSEEVQLAAVRQYGFAIWHVKKPCKTAQVQAVKFDPEVTTHLNEPFCDDVTLALLMYHPLYPNMPKTILDRAPEILEAHCPGLSDVYLIGRSMAMPGEELSRTMIEWIESHADVTIGAEMAP